MLDSLTNETTIEKEFQDHHTSITLLHKKIVIGNKLSNRKMLIVMLHNMTIHSVNNILQLLISNDSQVHKLDALKNV